MFMLATCEEAFECHKLGKWYVPIFGSVDDSGQQLHRVLVMLCCAEKAKVLGNQVGGLDKSVSIRSYLGVLMSKKWYEHETCIIFKWIYVCLMLWSPCERYRAGHFGVLALFVVVFPTPSGSLEILIKFIDPTVEKPHFYCRHHNARQAIIIIKMAQCLFLWLRIRLRTDKWDYAIGRVKINATIC